MRRSGLAFAAVAMTLAACQDDGSTASGKDTRDSFVDRTEGCAKAAVAPFIGQTEAALAAVTLPAPVRVIPPKTPVTQDFRPERTNIDLDAQGRIVRVWCG